MRDLGQVLKRRRETLGLGLEDVERQTKIRRRYLEALEAGDWSILPGDVYARGFVRSYAELVGLDGLKLLEEYIDGPKVERTLNSARDGAVTGANQSETSSERGPAPVDKAPLEPQDQEGSLRERDGDAVKRKSDEGTPYTPYTPPQPRRAGTTAPSPKVAKSSVRRSPRAGGALGQGIAVVAAFAVVAGAWWYISGRGHSGAAPSNGVNTAANLAAANTSQSSAASNNGTLTNTVDNNSTAQNATSPANGTSTGTAATAVVTQQPFNAQNQLLSVSVSGTGPIVINATAANGQCWVSVMADGKTIDGNDFVSPASPKTWNGNQEVRVRLGNVPVVSLTVNGTPITLPNTHYAIDVDVTKAST